MSRTWKAPCTAALLLALAACNDGQVTTAPEADAPALSSANGAANANDAARHIYRITVENLTATQPFSPGVVATHTKDASVFRVGEAASEGVRMIAENGDPSVAVADLSGAAGVDMVKVFPDPLAPIHRVGGPGPSTGSILISAAANANRLSLAIMLICTNDGFTGLESVKLPGGFQPAVYYTSGYDAGTEVNDEASTSIVDPCGAIGAVGLPADGNARTAEGGAVMHHPGIQGGADLSPADHGWNDPVARITVQRIE